VEAKGWTDDAGAAARKLLTLADDFERRHWLPDALDARVGALRLFESVHDPSAAALRRGIESDATKYGFRGVASRIR
jgi:hypothetical protein